ncbi:ribonuclease H-like domain-containing protein [Tanacetum coccineum]
MCRSASRSTPSGIIRMVLIQILRRPRYEPLLLQDQDSMAQGQRLAVRLRMVYTGGDGQQVFVSHTWRRLFGIQAPLVREFILEFLSTCRMCDIEMGLDVADTLYRDFLGPTPSYVHIKDPVRRLYHRMIAYNIFGRGQGTVTKRDGVKIDDSNITIEEYIRLVEEKARRRGKVYNWETATYGKFWDNEDVYNLGSVETEFPAIVFNDTLTSEATLSCEPTVSSLNDNEIDFRISFNESDDEDYTPMVSYFDDLDFFKDFENEFPAIVYNEALTSKSDLLTESILNPQQINEFNLKDETSLSECDEEEQIVLNFNDLFPFNVIYPNDSKSDKDNDDDKVNIEHSLRDLSIKSLPDVINTDVGAYAHGTLLNYDMEVIVNGDSISPVASTSAGAECLIPPKTAKQKLAWKNELKTKSTLMLAISDEHLLKFHACKDAKSLWEAIKNRFGSNKESKKMQKTILKKNYENFAASSQEGLDKTYDRFQKLISQLEIHGEVISQEDANLKLLRKIKGQSSSSSNSHNVAFVSSDNSSNINETVNNAHNVSAASSKDKASTTSYADDVMFSFFSNQSNAPHSSSSDSEAPRNQGNRNRDAPRRNAPVDTSTTNVLVVQDGIGSYDWSFQAEEGLINFALMAYTFQGSLSSSSSDYEVHTCSKDCLKSYEALKKQYDQQREALNKSNLEIIGYQMGLAFIRSLGYAKDKTGLGYDGQINESDLNDIHVNESEVLDNFPLPTLGTTPLTRPFNQKSAAKTNNFNEKVNTSKVNNVTTVGPKAVVSVAKGNRDNDIKTSACWIWRPKGSLIDHIFKDSGSYTPKRFDYVDPQGRLNPTSQIIKKLMVDLLHLGEMLKEVKLLEKVKLELEKLEFEDVYFMKELKFNLFSVSQMYDKKNSILFTDTECVVLSPDFKLLDESQVLLKVPRNNNMYSFDLKNVVPLGGRKPALSFMRPFGCPVTILNTLDHLGKFDGKSDDGFFVGYSINSKAFRVFNTRTRFVKENMHINFLENKPNVAGTTGPNWMFDIDTLTMFMNYQPISAGNQTNDNVGTKANIDAGQAGKKTVLGPQYVLLPFLTSNSQGPKSSEDEKDVRDQEEALRKQFEQEFERLSGRERAQRNEFESVFGQDKDANGNSIYRMVTPVSAAGSSYDNLSCSIPVNAATLPNADLFTDPLMPDLEDIDDL